MTVGKFITGTFKFMANFMVLIIVGMSSFYLWNELQPLPQADNLVIAPAGTNFLRDPEGFLRAEGYDYADFSKLMKGDYFATAGGGMLDTVPREAVEYGLTYWPYDFSAVIKAEQIYNQSGTGMEGIKVWLGSWENAGLYFGLGAKYGPNGPTGYDRDNHAATAALVADGFNDYNYDAHFYEREGRYWSGGQPGASVLVRRNRPRPNLNEAGTGLVKPSLHFASLTEMRAELLENGWIQEDIDVLTALWYLRIGTTVDSYRQMRAMRMDGFGSGGGSVGAIDLAAGMLLGTIRFDFFGLMYEKVGTVITDVSVKAGRALLAPLLTVANLRLEGSWSLHGGIVNVLPRVVSSEGVSWFDFSDRYAEDEIWYYADGTAAISALTNDALVGPIGRFVASSGQRGTLPTQALLEQIRSDYSPQRRTFMPEENGAQAPRYMLENIWLCEFGLPGYNNMSDHIVDSRTIKEVEIGIEEVEVEDGGVEVYYSASITPYNRLIDGMEWDFVSSAAARSLASNIVGGLVEDGGAVDYLDYEFLTLRISLWRSGLVRTWESAEGWAASLMGTAVMSATADQVMGYSYCFYDIVFGQGDLSGFGLLYYITEIRGLF
jgi:hypothetical protein